MDLPEPTQTAPISRTFEVPEPIASAMRLLLSAEAQERLRAVHKGTVTIRIMNKQAYAIEVSQELRPGKEIKECE